MVISPNLTEEKRAEVKAKQTWEIKTTENLVFEGLESRADISLIFLFSSVSRESIHTEWCYRNAHNLDQEKSLVVLVRNIEMPFESVRWLKSLDRKFNRL